MLVRGSGGAFGVQGDESFPVNRGALCIKGWTAGELLRHRERLTTPLARSGGELKPVSWDEALGLTAEAVKRIQAEYGRSAVGVFGSGSLTNEKAYLLGKFARVALGTPNIDYNGRYCMSSAAAAAMRAFGIDRGLPFPVEDIAGAEVILLCGANVAETMPPIMHYFDAQRAAGGRLIVVDPRRTETAKSSTLHLRLRPGTDSALANGMMHVLVRDGLLDTQYIARWTEGFEAVRATASTYWPDRVERITGVPEESIVQAATMLGRARTAMVLTARGAEQQSQGVDNVLAYVNLALASGRPGRPFSGFGCITGQGNGQGGREHGQKADQLPGYRRIDDPAARKHIASIWGVDEASLPGPGQPAFEMLSTAGTGPGVRALLVFGSNVAVSSPHLDAVDAGLGRLDFLAVSDFFLSETAGIADVVFPAAQWAEEEGTITNLEGRVLRRRQVIPAPPGVRTDIEVIQGIASLLGAGLKFNFASSRDVFEELRAASRGGAADYGGITYERIEKENGVFWPCPSPDHPGTPRLFSGGFFTASGRARFTNVRHRQPAEQPDEEYPLILTTGRLKVHYQSGTQTRRVGRLAALSDRPSAEMSPATAARYGLSEGQAVTLASRRGEAEFMVKPTNTLPPGTVFVPFHWGGAHAANRLTNPALDPVSHMPEFKVCAVKVKPATELGVR